MLWCGLMAELVHTCQLPWPFVYLMPCGVAPRVSAVLGVWETARYPIAQNCVLFFTVLSVNAIGYDDDANVDCTQLNFRLSPLRLLEKKGHFAGSELCCTFELEIDCWQFCYLPTPYICVV